MPTPREVDHMRRQAIIERAVSEAVAGIPTLRNARLSSAPDDTGSGGFFEDDGDGVLTYSTWFRAGDLPDGNPVRPY